MKMFRKQLEILNPMEIAEVEICNSLVSHTGLGALGIGIAPNFKNLINNYHSLKDS